MTDYKIVPIEPTEAMIEACQGQDKNHPCLVHLSPEERTGPLFPLAYYRAMMKSAPQSHGLVMVRREDLAFAKQFIERNQSQVEDALCIKSLTAALEVNPDDKDKP